MKKALRFLLGAIGLLHLVRKVRNKILGVPNVNLNKHHKEVFSDIHKKNVWGSKESVSGTGSTIETARQVIADLESVIRDNNVRSVLDIPCGDFNWMKKIDFERLEVEYLGCDIVPEIIESNKQQYEKNFVSFEVKDVIEDPLGRHDLIICRDCLVHFSFDHIKKAIRNIKASNSTFLILTSFVKTTSNRDILTGEWRPLNVTRDPLNFPQPIAIYNEKFTESGYGNDKSLFLYRVETLPDF